MELPVFLINLDRSTDRLASAAAELAVLGLDFTRLAAVDGASVDPAALRALGTQSAMAHLGRALLPGEIGCFLSHIVAARRIVAEGLPYALVVEDDLASRPGTRDDLVSLAGLLASGAVGDWDLINLGRAPRRFFRPLHRLPSGAMLVRAHYFPVTTTAILWSGTGAARFLGATAELAAPVDVFLQSWLCRSGRGLACRPALFSDSGARSQIASGRRSVGTLARLRRQVGNNLAALKTLVSSR